MCGDTTAGVCGVSRVGSWGCGGVGGSDVGFRCGGVWGSCWDSVAVVVRGAWWIGVVNFSPTLQQICDAIIYRQRFIFKAYVYCVKKTVYTDVHVTK